MWLLIKDFIDQKSYTFESMLNEMIEHWMNKLNN